MTQRQGQVKVLTIKQFAQICRTTPRTLRFYEKLGLISPSHIDPWTKYRSYTPEQARDFLQIKLLQDFQMPLKKIQLTLSQKAIKETITEQLQTIKKTIEEKQKEYTFLQTIQEFLFEKPNIKKYFKTQTVGPFSLLTLHISRGEYDKVPQYLSTLEITAQRMHITTTKDQFLFYGNTRYEPKSAMLDVAILAKHPGRKTVLPTGYAFKTIPKTKALVFSYTGPYEFLTLIYPKLLDYIEKKKMKLSGQIFDWYVENPTTVTSPYEYITKLIFPISLH